MKAEQRKELETNTLADKMGHMMQRVKTSERRTYVIYGLIVLAVVVGGWLGFRWYVGDVAARSEQWVLFYDGSGSEIDKLARLEQSNVAKAARFQRAWNFYWNHGVKMLATDKAGAVQILGAVAEEYRKLAEDCKEDPNPMFHLQALLGRAVATESMAVEDRVHLKKAKEYYEDVIKKGGDNKDKYAETKFAQERLDVMEKNGAELSKSYGDLQAILDIPPPLPPELKGMIPGGRKQ